MSPIWSNWPGEQVCAPSAIVRPTSEAELADVIAQAAKRGERVRAVGSGHSFTDIACTDGVMIDMTGLQRVLDVDQPTGLVTVEGGAKLRALGPQLAQRRLGLENQGDVDPQSITGATATATHGTGVRFQNLSARIVSLRLVTAGEMAPLPQHVVVALQHGPQAGMALLAFDDAASIVDEGYQQTENGYGILGDGSMQVSVRTDMPGVTPAMWAWWFGWHGSDTRRYKLWHPRAHLSARWKDGDQDSGAGRRGAQRYVGRWSMISEYIGSTKLGAAIQFVEPAAMGLPDDSDDTVSICARLGSADAPVDAGWFVHQVRSTPGGSEMRSRFWMGGPHIAVRKAPEVASKAVRPIASKLIGVSESTARNLLVYCAQEMNHLAGFLADLWESFGDE